MKAFRSNLTKQQQLTIYSFLNTLKKHLTQGNEYLAYTQYSLSYNIKPVSLNTYKRHRRNYNRVLRKQRSTKI